MSGHCSHHFAIAATTATMRAVIIARPLPLIAKLYDDEVAVNQRF